MDLDLPFTEALQREAAKVDFPTALRTDMLQRIPAQLRARARFSAGMIHADYLSHIQRAVDDLLNGRTDSATAALELDRALAELGFEAPGADKEKLTDHRSYVRRRLVLDTNVAQAGNYGQWVQGTTPVALEEFPCWEFYRAFARQAERDWRGRWLAAGGRLFEGRMIAPKDDPIWTNPTLNRLGTPYPPYDFGSGMRLRPVDRDESIRLGVIESGATVPAPFGDFQAEASLGPIEPALRQAAAAALADVAEVDGSTIRMRGPRG